MEMSSTPKLTRTGNQAVLTPVRDITAASSTEVRAVLKSLVAEGVRDLEINLVDVRVVDSSGIGLLVAAHNSLERLGGKLTVTHVSEDLMELFKAFRLEKHFPITGM